MPAGAAAAAAGSALRLAGFDESRVLELRLLGDRAAAARGSHALEDLLLLYLELRVGQHALRVKVGELLELVHRVVGHAA